MVNDADLGFCWLVNYSIPCVSLQTMQKRSRHGSDIETLEKMVLMSASLVEGTEAADLVEGSDGDNFINGHGGDDRIHAGLGANFVDGGDGVDTLLVPEGHSFDFRIEKLSNGAIRLQGTDSATGADIDSTLINVEQIQFRDELIELDQTEQSGNGAANQRADATPLSNNEAFLFRVAALTNDVRTSNGLHALTINDTLQATALLQSTNMAEQDFFSHTGTDGLKAWHRAENLGYDYQSIGENIAAGQLTPEEVVQEWVNSPGHLANILNPAYTEIGVGYQYLENDTGVVNYHHYWTQVFGTEQPSVTPELTAEISEDSRPNKDTLPPAEPTPEVTLVQPPPVEQESSAANLEPLANMVDSAPPPVAAESEPVDREPEQRDDDAVTRKPESSHELPPHCFAVAQLDPNAERPAETVAVTEPKPETSPAPATQTLTPVTDQATVTSKTPIDDMILSIAKQSLDTRGATAEKTANEILSAAGVPQPLTINKERLNAIQQKLGRFGEVLLLNGGQSNAGPVQRYHAESNNFVGTSVGNLSTAHFTFQDRLSGTWNFASGITQAREGLLTEDRDSHEDDEKLAVGADLVGDKLL